jgi:hypothetical protein
VERFLFFASQSHHKYKENKHFSFSGQVKASVIVSLFPASGSFNQLVNSGIVHATAVRIVPF